MLKEKISEFIDMIRSIEGVAACALVSRDGIVAGKYFDRDLNERLGASWQLYCRPLSRLEA
jgi:predicted regulator of Ras-like GTPase activity (Roadblock/LC7/MglB family)